MKHADTITPRDDRTVSIPGELTKRFKGGEILVAVRDDDKLVLEEVKAIDEQLLEDLEFARRTREAWKRYENGEFRTLSVDELLAEMATW